MQDTSTVAILAGVIVALVKLIEWIIKKYNKGEDTIRLSEENSRQLRESHSAVIMMERNLDDMKIITDKLATALKDVSECLRKVSETQYKMSELLDKIDRRQEVQDAVNKALSEKNG